MTTEVLLGYEVGTGLPVNIPINAHLAVTGQTQLSGKTTTLEAIVARSGLKAIAFVTKRAEGSFAKARSLPPYFRERADWQFVSAVLEATLREKMKFERSWIMRACKGAKTLSDVRDNVQEAMKTAKGLSGDVYYSLNEYLGIVTPQIERLDYSTTIDLAPGLNVMDLSAYTSELQALVIRSVLEWVYEHSTGTLVIIPEAWEFIPQKRGSPVLLACEALIRKGGSARNFIWLDSQDIAAVNKDVLRSVGVWILGVQREANEVKRALSHIPGNVRKPKPDDIMGLERGQFFACFGKTVVKTYVRPAWAGEADARDVALGGKGSGLAEIARTKPKASEKPKEKLVDEKEAAALRDENARLKSEVENLTARLDQLAKAPTVAKHLGNVERAEKKTVPPMAATGFGEFAENIIAETIRRVTANPGVLAAMKRVPEIEVTVERQKIEADESSLRGRVAILISEGFFDALATGSAAFTELKRRGFGTAKPNVYKECDKLATAGFLTKERDGYRAVPGMKVRIIEKDA